MSRPLPAAALLLRQPFANGLGAELAVIADEVGGVLIARPLDASESRVFDVTPTSEFYFPPREHAARILGPERAVWLIGGTPALTGREGYAEVCRLLPAMQLELARAHGTTLPPPIARRLGLPVEPADDPMFPEFPGANDDTPHT